MDVHGVDVIEGNIKKLGACAPSNNGGDAEPPGESQDANACARDQDEVIVEPQVGMEFSTKDAAYNFYEEYAKRVGFGTRVAQAPRLKPGTPITAREFLCAREGSKRKPDDSCGAMLKVELDGERWVVTRFVKDHNHSTMSPSKVHYLRPKRHFAGSTKNAAAPETCQVVEVAPSPTGGMPAGTDGNRQSGEANSGSKSAALLEPIRQMRNINPAVNYANSVNYAVRPAARTKILGKDAQDMLDYFRKMQAENPGFFYAIQLDEENRMANAFWADARSRTAYSNFGDFVFFDTSYRVNQYKVPFAPFTGVNHHGRCILFGCALLQDDSEASFIWLFKTFLAAMHDQAPISIVTDQDRAIKVGVSQVFPKARHRISMWDLLKEGQDRLLHVCLIYPNFQMELYNCINVTETVEEFESSWASIIEKYSLRRNDWLQSVYNMRKLWVPVYFRDSFFAALSPHQGLTNSFFDGYINQHTTLPMFFRQYESAMENWFEKEKEADFDTMCTTPVLKTPSPMEKQAANLYTKKIFSKFQQQLVETFVYTANKIDGDSNTSAYRVAKFEDNHKAYVVTLNNSDLRAHCSCKMFEYSGIPCRHVLTVFTVTNVLTLPSHFILKRWTRDAKSGVSLDERGVDSVQESMTLRYNNLCREAIKYAEEGSVARETYKTALAGLREGGKKVAIMKKNVAKVASPSSLAAGACFDNNKTSGDVTPLLWPRQDQVGRRFNLNDSGNAPRQMADLNLPRMALQRDNGTSENMAVLPCLKSMTWAMENKHLAPASRIAVINLKLQDHSKTPAGESEVKFQLSTVTLEPMMRSMAHINEQLTSPANRVAVINLKLQDTEATSGESEVKFQVSRDTLGAMLRSMAYIREQLCIAQVEPQTDPPPKRPKK